MKKRWIVPIVGLLLTIIFAWLALTWGNDFVIFNTLINGDRFSNLMSDFAGWSVALTGIVTLITLAIVKVTK